MHIKNINGVIKELNYRVDLDLSPTDKRKVNGNHLNTFYNDTQGDHFIPTML